MIDLSHLERKVFHCPKKLAKIFSDIAAIPDNELVYRQQAGLEFMDQSYEQLWGLEPFLKAFDRVLDVLALCASS